MAFSQGGRYYKLFNPLKCKKKKKRGPHYFFRAVKNYSWSYSHGTIPENQNVTALLRPSSSSAVCSDLFTRYLCNGYRITYTPLSLLKFIKSLLLTSWLMPDWPCGQPAAEIRGMDAELIGCVESRLCALPTSWLPAVWLGHAAPILRQWRGELRQAHLPSATFASGHTS